MPAEPHAPLRFEHLTVDDGLSQNSAYGIFQDQLGFIWIGTAGGGLNRFDGYEVKVYRSIPGDSTSLAAGNPGRFLETKDGILWIGTRRGLSRMDPETERFTNFQHDPDDPKSLSSDRITALAESPEGDIWVGTEAGLNRLQPSSGRIVRYFHDPDEPPTGRDAISSLHIDSAGYIWAATTDGVTRLDPRSGKTERHLASPEPLPMSSLLEPDYVSIAVPERIDHLFTKIAVIPGEPHLLWLTGRGLVRFDTRTGRHERYLAAPNTVPGSDADMEQNLFWSVIPDPNDGKVLWIASRRHGLLRFDRSTGRFTRYLADPDDPASLSTNRLISLHADRTGMIWVGTQEAGICRFDPAGGSFLHVRHIPDVAASLPFASVRGIAEDRDGSLYVATNQGGLTRIDRSEGLPSRFTHWQSDPDSAGALRGVTFPVLVDRQGTVWVGTTGEAGGGLFRLNEDELTFTRYPHRADDPSTLSHSGILTLYEDRAGSFWVGTEAGLNRLDRTTGRAERFLSYRDPPAFVKALYEDGAGRFWVGTWTRGLALMDRTTGESTWHLPGFRINSIYEREREPNVLWLATYGNGLFRFDTGTGEMREYGVDEGLPDYVVYGLLEDRRGHLWMSTNRGIARFDPEREVFYHYGTERGIQSWEFNNTSYFQSPRTGEMFFGGINGLNIFHPDKITSNIIPPPVVLTGLRLFNRPVRPGEDRPITRPIHLAREIVLKPQHDVITFEFAALHYEEPKKNRYRYLMEGFNAEWIEAGTQRAATFTNLPPGDYTFRVQASNADGIWNEQGASIRLSMLPPWWRTGWAYLAYVLFFVVGVFLADRVQRRRVIEQERRRTEMERARLRVEAAEADARALAAENERHRNAELLADLGRALTASLDLDTIFDRLYENVQHLMEADSFGVGVYDPVSECIEYRLAAEDGQRYAPYTREMKDKNQFAVWCIEHREVVFLNDVQVHYGRYIDRLDYRQERLADGSLSNEAHSLIYLPLLAQDRVLGVITVQSFRTDAYADYDVSVLRTLASYTSVAIDNAEAYRQLSSTLDELRTAQARLVQQEKMASLGELTAGIAHELKNPLNFINNFSSVIRELVEEVRVAHQENDLEAAGELLRELELSASKIEEHGSRADGIIKAMMLHARGGSHRLESVELNGLTEKYVQLAYHGRRAASSEAVPPVDLQLDPGVGDVDLVPQEIGQVLLNLLDNAFDAVAERAELLGDSYEPRVHVETRSETAGVSIRICDNGTGIPAEVLPHICEPFFTTKPSGSGTGLGLSISYDIVTQGHAGTFEIESTAGAGTCFTLALPRTTRLLQPLVAPNGTERTT